MTPAFAGHADRNYIISNFLAFEQPVAVQIANIDSAVPEPHIGAAEFTFHAKRALAHVEHDLAREFPEQSKHAQAVFGHTQRHGYVVSALEFQVYETTAGDFAEQVHPGVLHFRQFDV